MHNDDHGGKMVYQHAVFDSRSINIRQIRLKHNHTLEKSICSFESTCDIIQI